MTASSPTRLPPWPAGAAGRPRWAGDDDEIDNRDARPGEGRKRPESPRRNAADLVEDTDFVREHGGYRHAGVPEVAMRFGVSKDALERALSRVRRREADLDLEAG